MSQIIRPLTACPARAGRLAFAAAVLLDAVREWIADYREGRDPITRFRRTMRFAGLSATPAGAFRLSPDQSLFVD